MRMRTIAILAGVLAAVLWAAPAQAKLVYVKRAGTVNPVVYVAKDNGKDPRRLGIGRSPTISPNGQWVAFISASSNGAEMETVVLQRLQAGSQRLVMRSKGFDSLRFSPDSTKLAAIAADTRIRVYDIASDRAHVAAAGRLRGYSFSPDGTQFVFGRAVDDGLQSDSDLYVVPVQGGEANRITTVGNALNPVWGPTEIVFDRFGVRRGDSPAYNLWALEAAAPEKLRQLTKLKIPPLVSGLVPLEVSADAKRMLAVFTGQDVQVGFTVALASGKTRALSTDFEMGTVGFDLSRDGRTILAHTGGPDPGAAHDVVKVPYGRPGKTKVVVEDASFPDWTR